MNVAEEVAAAASLYGAARFSEAAHAWAGLSARFPQNPDYLRLHGLSLVRAGAGAPGLALLEAAHARDAGNPLAALHRGIGLMALRRFTEAAALFAPCMVAMPENPAPALNLAAALLEGGDPVPALAAAHAAVARAPGSAEALYTRGLAEQANGDAAAAERSFAAAVARDARRAEAWVNLGLCRYQRGDIAAATAAMLGALKASPGHAAAEVNLAVFDSLRGSQVGAMERLRRVLAHTPRFWPARLNLASQLILDGEPAEALTVLGATPPEGGAAGAEALHWRAQRISALMLLRRVDEARTELAAWDGAAAGPGQAGILIGWRRLLLAAWDGDHAAADRLAGEIGALADIDGTALLEHRIIAQFDLARYHHGRGRTPDAFARWRAGHRLLARVQPFDRAAYADFVAASIAAYSRGRHRPPARRHADGPAPVFIVGLPRSGTTLTEQILAAHHAVHGGGERTAIYDALSRLAQPVLGAPGVRRAASLPAEILAQAGHEYLAGLRAAAPGARMVTDKMPGNAQHLGFIADILPSARIVHCTRDPRDTGLSIFQLRFFGYHPYAHDLADLGWFIGQHQRLMTHWQNVLPLPMLTVRLSDWVEDFPGTLARLLEFLDLPDDPACAAFHRSTRKVRTASARQVQQPVNARGLGRWRSCADELAPMIAELAAAELLPAG
jgi:tetratricopeptide (TPR) repeat protein